MVRILFLIGIALGCTGLSTFAQITPATSLWQGALKRNDGKEIIFLFELQQQQNKTLLDIRNASEKLRVDSVVFKGDSVFIVMPVFESTLMAKVLENGNWQGVWRKGTAGPDQLMPFYAQRTDEGRFKTIKGKSWENISGRWQAGFTGNNTTVPAIGEFRQAGDLVSGTFLTPTGDYRYLEGVVTGDSLILSSFDGGHAYLFTATVKDKRTITDGMFYSGPKARRQWSAVKNDKASLPDDGLEQGLQPIAGPLDFTFTDLDGNRVSIKDERFRNKVVIIQLMGSWCPNCMDETAFLSAYYNNRDKDVEIISLAYEYTTDFERSRKSLNKFRRYFNVRYPMLITNVSVTDSLRTQKTLPQLPPIEVFPTTVFVDKKGIVRKIDTEFFGPGTGRYYEDYKKRFYRTVKRLVRE